MKKRLVALALVIGAAVVTVTSSCYMGYGYYGHPHYHRYYHDCR